MGKAGKRKEMVEDRCVQEMHLEARCVKEFRVKVLLVKEVCVKVWCVEGVCVCLCLCVCVYTVITNGFNSCHRSCTIQKKNRGQRYPCHFLCQRSWVTRGKDIDQGRLIYVPAIVSTVDFLFLFMSCALFLRS